ncbi:MAG TPA: hypothetical protein VF482_08560 [Trebonia sp.]
MEFPRRGEVAAACAVLVLLIHLLFAQLTFILAVAFVAVSKASRWRLWWLTVPAVVGLAWTAAIGPRVAAAGFTAGPDQILGYLSGHPLSRLMHPHGAFAGAGSWLLRQAPLALIAATAEAAIAGWLDWLHTDEWAVPPPRPGLVAAVRGEAARRAIRGSTVVTRDGCCLGVAPATGARATLRWAEIAGGALFTGDASTDIVATSFQVVHAALRLRKPVIGLDLSGDPTIAEALARVCWATTVPFRIFGTEGGYYEPFRAANAGRRLAMTLALISPDDAQARHAGATETYLRGAFELMDAVPAGPQTPVLDDIAHLLNPLALQARAELIPASGPRAGALAAQIRECVRMAQAEPEIVLIAARDLEAVRASPAGRWLGPGAGQADGIDLGRVIRERSAALFARGTPGMTRLVCADIIALGDHLRGIGADGDGIVWLCGCEALPRELLARLVSSGAAAGLPVLATSTLAAPEAVAGLASVVNAVAIHRLADSQAAATLAARTGTRFAPAAAAAVAMSAGRPTALASAGAGHVPLAPAGIGRPAPPPVMGAPAPTTELLPGPAVAEAKLMSLRPGQFVLTVSSPRYRLVELAETVPARLPRGSGRRDGR